MRAASRATRRFQVDIRVIAASNRDLLKAVGERTFREDLFYRLNVFPIELPPLRVRTDDIPLMTHFFVNKFMARIGKQFRSIGRQTMERLVAYSWPGNVRELENILERAVILAQDGKFEIGPTLLPAATAGVTGNGQLDLATLEYDHIRKVLEQTSGVINGPRERGRDSGATP